MAKFDLRGTGEFRIEIDVNYNRDSTQFEGVILASHTNYSSRIQFGMSPSGFVELYYAMQEAILEGGFPIGTLETLDEADFESSETSQFGSVFDEPLDTPAGSTTESRVIGELAAAELAERQAASLPISPDALDDLADKVVSIFEAEDAAKTIGESPVPTVPSNLKLRPWIVYQGDKPLCVIPAETLDEAQSILKFETGRFTFSLKIRQSDWSEENAVLLPLHADWVKKMDADLAAKRAAGEATATGTAVGDDGPILDGEVA